MTRIIKNEEIYSAIFEEMVPAVKKYLWIATADIKDLHVKRGKRAVPFLDILSELINKGILVRLIHSKEPGEIFRKDFDRNPALIDSLERMLCPRNHMKLVIIDGKTAICGSANLTGAGMGCKSPNRRNFEMGIVTDEKKMVAEIAEVFDALWMGQYCKTCGRKEFCGESLT
ncbi:MAG: hypothetical protein KA885_11340 [Spirochaetes bacterium]|nr:hypothetical protein [Spirochaetota bacterium]